MHDQATSGALPPPIPRKSRVSLRLDAEVLGWVRGQVREHGGDHDPYGRHEAPWWRAVQHESRVQHRISQLLAQEYEQLLTPEAKQRREA